MKIKQLSALLVLVFFAVINFTYTQTWCMELPSIAEEIEVCNRNIARAFAPILYQYTDITNDHSLSGNCDRILKVNYDVNSNNTSNWVATDNWDNLDNVGNPSFSQYDIRPHVYYAVTWTEEAWIVVYSFYYARDWADGGTGCNEDQHEGDVAKVFVVIKRPDSANQPSEEMLLGYRMTIEEEFITCPTEGGVTIIKPFQNSTTALGAHPHIWAAAGSHHFYRYPVYAEFDEHHKILNAGCVVNGQESLVYHPPANDADVTTVVPPKIRTTS